MNNDKVAELVISILRYRYKHDVQNSTRQRHKIAEYYRTGKVVHLGKYRPYSQLLRQLEAEVKETLQDDPTVSNLSESI